MRLTSVCLPLVLAPLLLAGEQTPTTGAQKPAQPSAAKQTTSLAPHKKATRHRRRHHARTAAARKSATHAEKNAIPVDVIQGGELRHVVLDESTTAGASSNERSGQMKVQVINGSATDTQYFSGKTEENVRNQPVVVSVQSSETRFAGGNKSPVVTGVTSSSTVDAKSTSTGGQPVAKQVSPRPKRPAYAPDQH